MLSIYMTIYLIIIIYLMEPMHFVHTIGLYNINDYCVVALRGFKSVMGHVREGIHFQSRIVVINFTALESAKLAPGENTLEVVFKMHIDFSFENGGNLIRNVPTFWRGWGRSSRRWACHGDWACHGSFILWLAKDDLNKFNNKSPTYNTTAYLLLV